MRRLRDDDDGSSAVEFVLVGTLLTLLTLAVLQLALAVYIRNVVHDAAVEGAYHGALADTDAAAVMDGYPGCPGACGGEGVEEGPVGDGVGAVEHGFGFPVG